MTTKRNPLPDPRHLAQRVNPNSYSSCFLIHYPFNSLEKTC